MFVLIFYLFIGKVKVVWWAQKIHHACGNIMRVANVIEESFVCLSKKLRLHKCVLKKTDADNYVEI